MTVQRSVLFTAFLCLFGFAGCSGLPANRTGADGHARVTEGMEWENSDPLQRALQPGDRVHIKLYSANGENEIVDIIDDEGAIKLPLIDKVRVAGMNTREAEESLEDTYVAGRYYKTISITMVTLSASAQFDQIYVGGEVIKPGPYPLTPNLTLTKAIISAGGMTDYALARKVQITRNGRQKYYHVGKINSGRRADPALLADDKILVPQKRLF